MTGNYPPTGPTRPVFLFLTLLLTSVVPGLRQAQAAPLPVATLTIGQHQVQAEVASGIKELTHGLMGRKALPRDHGMLFVFDRAEPWCFWMKNTPLPLSIAFIQANGVIVAIDDMQPFTETTHCPPRAISYALEMTQGWFKRAGVRIGQTVNGLPRHKAPRR